jgi:phospholipid/cholesterol/gamma-HCH transport system substrate-binding protein
MDPLKSSKSTDAACLPVPKRSFSLEFYVGLFMLAGVAAVAYLSIGLAGVQVGPGDTYDLLAEFDNISGLKYGASVEIAGVPIGQVSKIELKDPAALITLRLDQSIKIRDDDIASIRTKGIIGDRYVKISRGSSDKFIPVGGVMTETESVVDIEDVIGKVVHSLTGDKDDEQNK